MKEIWSLRLSTGLKTYYHVTFSLACGILITICLFIASLKIESDRYRNDFSVISETLGSNLDLLISNQIIRIQNFDNELRGAVKNVHSQRLLIDAILRGSSFTDLVDIRIEKGFKTTPKIHIVGQIDVDRSFYLDPRKMVHEAAFAEAVHNLFASKSKSSPLLLQVQGRALLVLLWRSAERSNRVFAFVGLAEKLIPSENFVKKELFVVLQHRDNPNNMWLVSKDAKNEVAFKPISVEGVKELRARSTNNRVYEPGFYSGAFSYEVFSVGAVELRYFWPLTVLFLGLIITSLFSFLLFSLINRNIEINQVVIEKTKHLAIESQKAMDAAYSKTRFLANVSHEVRTPLNMIMGMAELLKETDLSTKQSEFVDNLRSAGSHLLSLIDDILDMARIDSNEVKFSGENFNLLYFFEEVAQLIAPACQLKGVQFYARIDPRLPQLINTDPRRLRQILINLLNNALKFTEKGFIELTLDLFKEPDSKGNDYMEICVRDTGIGIPTAKREAIFRAFYQVNPSVTRSKGGVGLGLSIVQAIVSRFKGRIHVSSAEREGSIFTVELPLQSANQNTVVENFRWKSAPIKNILIACQDKKLAQTLIQYSASAQVRASLWTVDLKEEDFDIIFCDVLKDIPNANIAGFSKILSDKLKGHVVFIQAPILLSSFYQYIGMQDFALKNRKLQEVAIQREPIMDLDKDASLLIVDDDIGNRTLMKAYLEGLKLRTRFAANGQEALDMYRQEIPDILVADLQMPIMDGFTLVNRIRELEDENPQNMKIMILTADALDETAEQARQLNVDAYLTKPIRKGQFLGTISELLN